MQAHNYKHNYKYMKQISSAIILINNLCINHNSTKYITEYRQTPIHNFNYLELRLMYTSRSLIQIKPIQIITTTPGELEDLTI